MEKKFCTGCNLSKSLSSFARKNKGLQSRCRDCQNSYHKQHYQDNVKNYKDRAKKRNKSSTEKIRIFIQEQKDKPCQDCGIKYPYYVMDFDHRPGEEKCFAIANMARTRPSLEKVIEEINKCDIVCSNCHRIRTHNRDKSQYPIG
jgi:hypothetical protein